MAESCFNLQRIFGAEISLKAGEHLPLCAFNESQSRNLDFGGA